VVATTNICIVISKRKYTDISLQTIPSLLMLWDA